MTRNVARVFAGRLRAPAFLVRPDGVTTVPVAHRGAPRHVVENSAEGFERAVALGAWMVELDVRETADGEIVVFHDESLDRLTGASGLVRDARMSDLDQLRLRGGLRIPRLAEVLHQLHERSWVNVEIKAAFDPDRIAAVVQEVGMTDQVVVSSFDWDLLDRFGRALPQVPRALLVEGRLGDPVGEMKARGAAGFHPDHPSVDRALVETIHASGGFVVPWTVDDPADLARLVAAGVDGLVSNEIEALVAACGALVAP